MAMVGGLPDAYSCFFLRFFCVFLKLQAWYQNYTTQWDSYCIGLVTLRISMKHDQRCQETYSLSQTVALKHNHTVRVFLSIIKFSEASKSCMSLLF